MSDPAADRHTIDDDAPVKLYLVRHAKAGDRSSWDADDELRPLSAAGHRQALHLTDRLAPLEPPLLVSSPYVRCVQTLEPLGERLGLDVITDERLREGARFEDTLELLAQVPAHTVLCSHGDVIPDTVQALVRRGMELRSEPQWRKASVWVLRRKDDGRFTHATAWAPPTR